MKKTVKNLLQTLTISAAAVILSACGNAATPEPTVDMNDFATKAVQTVEARYTETALAMPTNTPEPTYTPVVLPTDTPQTVAMLPMQDANSSMITNTGADPAAQPAAAEAQPAAAEAQPAAIEVMPTAVVTIEPPTAVPTATSAAGGNKASYDSQTPADGTHMQRGQEFDITWYLLNTGTTTWTTDYSMRYFTGTNMTKPGKTYYRLNEAVAPNTVGACSIDAYAPSTPGTYQMSAVLSDENDQNFMIVDITIIVD